MSLAILAVALASAMGPVDPVGDVYWPGQPGVPAGALTPDLVYGDATVDAVAEEIRFDFEFTESVYPADDWDHMESVLYGYVDIDLDSPPIASGVSRKSVLSGYVSGLGSDAYIDLSLLMGGFAPLESSTQSLGMVPVTFDGTSVSISVSFDVLAPVGTVGDQVAYAGYFMDMFQMTSDVFPNGDGYLLSPEPGSLALMGLAMLGLRRRRGL